MATLQNPSGDVQSAGGTGTTGTGGNQIDSDTITASGGSTPAFDSTIAGITATQTASVTDVAVYVESDPAFNADYAFNFDYGLQWDDSDGELDLLLTVNWDTDPGGGNDVTLRWEAIDASTV